MGTVAVVRIGVTVVVLVVVVVAMVRIGVMVVVLVEVIVWAATTLVFDTSKVIIGALSIIP